MKKYTNFSILNNGMLLEERLTAFSFLPLKSDWDEIAKNNWNIWRRAIPKEFENEYIGILFNNTINSEEELKNVFYYYESYSSPTVAEDFRKQIITIYNKYSESNIGFPINLIGDDIKLSLIKLFFPIFLFGREKLLSIFGKKNNLKLVESLNSVEFFFLKQLIYLIYDFSEKTLVMELHVSKQINELKGNSSEKRFEYFINLIQQKSKIENLMLEYPLLFRKVFELTKQWCSNSDTIIRHMVNDLILIQETFNISNNSIITKIDFGKGDRHNGGKTVNIITFNDGKKILYKPRSLKIDKLYREIVEAINLSYGDTLFPYIKLIEKKEYGWVEFIEHAPCINSHEIGKYYFRYGALIALVYVLGGSDCHFENVIASKDFPYLVDLECLFSHQLQIDKKNPLTSIDTVLNSLLLPSKIYFENGMFMDIGAITDNGFDGETPIPIDKVKETGTDNMRYVKEKDKIENIETNVPRLKEIKVDASLYESEIIAGFTKTYDIIKSNQFKLINIVNKFRNTETRAILRHTSHYAHLISVSKHPNSLRNPLIYDSVLNSLLNDIVFMPKLKQVMLSEKQAINALDVPLYYTKINSRDLFQGKKIVAKDFFDETGFEKFKYKLSSLGDGDYQRQVWLIDAKLKSIKPPIDLYRFDKRNNIVFDIDCNSESHIIDIKKKILSSIDGISKKMIALSFKKDGYINWYNLTSTSGDVAQFGLLDNDLYGGLSGVALFFGCLYKITEKEEHFNVCQMILKTIYYNRSILSSEKIGVFDGFLGIIYIHFYLGEILKQEDLIECGLKMIEEELDENLNNLKESDIIGGVAGIIIVLSKIKKSHSINIDAFLLKLGNYLIDNYVEMEHGISWLSNETYLNGFAHGNSGIMLGLYDLFLLQGDKRWLDLFEKAFAYYEITNRNNVTLLKNQEQKMLPFYWCNGSAGNGIALLELLKRGYSTQKIKEELNINIESTIKNGLKHNHCLCHGALGNLDFLLQSAHFYKDEVLEKRIYQIINVISADIIDTGAVTGSIYNIKHPGFMTGLSGIGFQLIRFLEPHTFPSILSLDL